MDESCKQNWYAIKVFWGRTSRIKDILEELGIHYYAQKVLPSYMFIRTDRRTALRFREAQFGYIYLYSDRTTHEPVVVPEAQVEVFRIMTSAGADAEILPNPPDSYAVGDLVRVNDGPFKGAEGYIRRIRKDRRLVIVISGVAAIATVYIPPELLEKVNLPIL